MVAGRFQTGIESVQCIWGQAGKYGAVLPIRTIYAVLRIFNGIQRNAGVPDVFLVCGGGGRRGLLRRIDTQS